MKNYCLEQLEEFGRAIKEIQFKKVPRRDVLEALAEGNGEICFDFSNAGCIGSIYDAVGLGYANQITHATLETSLDDSAYLESFIKIKHLTLVCTVNDDDSLQPIDLGAMQLAILNLTTLKKLVLDVRYISESATSELEKYIKFPFQNFDFSIVKP